MNQSAQDLFERSVEHASKGQARPALDALLDALALDPTHADALTATSRLCRVLGSDEDAQLFEALIEAPDDAGVHFDLGWRMVEQQRPDLGCALLERSLKLEDTPAVRRELAFARLQTRDFAGCLTALSPLAKSPDLAEAEHLDAALLSAEAALYAGRRELTAGFLETAENLVPSDDQRARLDALYQLLGRSRHWPDLSAADLRAWHVIQHGGVILKTAGGPFEDGSRGGRFDVLDLREDMVAFLLQRLMDMLATWGLRPEAVAAASPTAEPLAMALANRWGIPLLDEAEHRAERPTLFVAAAAGEFAPFLKDIVNHGPDLTLFALNLDWSRDEVVCPEIVGVLAQRVFLPWETRFGVNPTAGTSHPSPGDTRAPELIAADLVAAMDKLPDVLPDAHSNSGGEARRAFEQTYEPLAKSLILGQSAQHVSRRRFTQLSPFWPEQKDRDVT